MNLMHFPHIKTNRIVFSGAFCALKQPTGVQRYAREILNSFDKLICEKNIEAEIIMPEYSKNIPSYKNIRIVRKGNMPLQIWNQTTLPFYAIKQKALCVDLCVSMPVLKPDYICIFDCITSHYPQNYVTPKDRRRRLLYLIRARMCTKRAGIILTDSETAKDDIAKTFNVSPKKIEVVYGAWQHIIDVKNDESVFDKYPYLNDEDYWLAVGHNEYSKNFSWVLETARLNKDIRFVITGSRFEGYTEQDGNITYTGYLTDGEIKALMSKCKVYCQPSFCEGFGMPPMEAMYCGAKIVLSNATCFPEVYGDSVYYVDPNRPCNDVNGLLTKNIEKPEKVLEKYSWDKSASKLLKVII